MALIQQKSNESVSFLSLFTKRAKNDRFALLKRAKTIYPFLTKDERFDSRPHPIPGEPGVDWAAPVYHPQHEPHRTGFPPDILKYTGLTFLWKIKFKGTVSRKTGMWEGQRPDKHLNIYFIRILKGQSNEIFYPQYFPSFEPACATDQWVKI